MKSHPSVKTKRVAKKGINAKHPHDKRVALRTKPLVADIKETELIYRFAVFLRKVLPQSAHQKTPQHRPQTDTRPKLKMLDIAETPLRSPIVQQTELPSVGEASASYEVSKGRLSSSSDDVETSDGDDVRGACEVSGPYLTKMRFLDEQCGIRRDGNTLMIGNSDITADEKGDITIGGKRFRGTRGLWELLSRRNAMVT